MELDKLLFLLNYCHDQPEIYGAVIHHLKDRFNIVSADIALIVTYYVCEERRKNEQH